MRRLQATALVGIVVTALVACGAGDDEPAGRADDGVRVVEIAMIDTAFEPDTLEVAEGETVRFVFTNTGEGPHDAFVGDRDDQVAHEAEMRAGDGHGGHGEGSDDAVTVEPGDEAELTHTFDTAGTFEIGCHQPGHYDAGMVLTVEVD